MSDTAAKNVVLLLLRNLAAPDDLIADFESDGDYEAIDLWASTCAMPKDIAIGNLQIENAKLRGAHEPY